MTTRAKEITPYNSNSSSADPKEKAGKVKVKANMSKAKNAGTEDALHAALGHRIPMLPSDNHIWTHTTTVTPVGAHYTPNREFGSLHEAMGDVGTRRGK